MVIQDHIVDMKNLSYSLVFVILFTLFAGCHKAHPYEPKRIVVAGQVTNYNPGKHDHSLSMIYYDLLEEFPIDILVKLDPEGKFRFEYYRSFPEEVYIDYGSLIPLHVFPGDSIFVRIDPRLLELANDTTTAYDRYNYISSNSLNNEYFAFYRILGNEMSAWINKMQDSAIISDPFKYKDLVIEQTNVFYSRLKEYEANHHTSKEFGRWMKSSIRNFQLSFLLGYSRLHAYSRGVDGSDFTVQMPAKYFEFLKDIDFKLDHAEEDVVTWRFLHECFNYNLAFIEQNKGGNNNVYTYAQGLILKNMRGNLGQVILARYYSSLIDKRELEQFRQLWKTRALTEPYYLSYLAEKFRKVDSLIKHPTIPADAFLNETEKQVTDGLLDSLVQRNKGKVLYIDFWGTWCGACLEEMPYSIKLQDIFKGKDVAFVYLCCRSQENLWKAKISELKLAGSHYLLTNDQYNVMAGKFNITGLPHYVLIDRKGRIVNKNAPTPFQKEAIVKELDKLLKN